jgi:hypothetical protein
MMSASRFASNAEFEANFGEEVGGESVSLAEFYLRRVVCK